MKNFLKKWIGPIIILTTILIVVIVGLVNGTLEDAVQSVLNAEPVFIAACFGCYFCYILVNALSLRSFLKCEGLKLSVKDAVTVSLTGIFYSNITPGATGGQPMQVYRLSQFDIPVGLGTSAVICSLLSWHVMRVLMVTVAAICYWNFIVTNMGQYLPFLFLGYAYNLFFVVLWMFFSFSKRPTAWIVRVIGKIVTKFKLSKDPDKVMKSVSETADKFYTGMLHLRSHKGEMARQLMFGGLYMISLVSIIYFAYRGVGLNSASYGEISTMGLCQYVSAAYVPTPGGSGAQEGLYELYFGKLMDKSSLLAVMLIWRFISYYLGLIAGAVMNLVNRKHFA